MKGCPYQKKNVVCPQPCILPRLLRAIDPKPEAMCVCVCARVYVCQWPACFTTPRRGELKLSQGARLMTWAVKLKLGSWSLGTQFKPSQGTRSRERPWPMGIPFNMQTWGSTCKGGFSRCKKKVEPQVGCPDAKGWGRG